MTVQEHAILWFTDKLITLRVSGEGGVLFGDVDARV
jgi:hypothetical protein